MKQRILFTVLGLGLSLSGKAQDDLESRFYTAPTNHRITRNFVEDYDVDNDFLTDDSKKLQDAIDEVTSKGGGTIFIPEGNYSLVDIQMKSNVHLEVDAKAIIKPSRVISKKSYVVFMFTSEELEPLNNVSLCGRGGNFLIDVRDIENKKIRVCNLKNVQNFLLSNIDIKDDYSKFSSFVFNTQCFKDTVVGPRNGEMKDINVYGSDYGYGVMQMQLGHNILFKNIYGEGGATLRFEPHIKSLHDQTKVAVIDHIVGRNIHCEEGQSALMLSPHFINNGVLDMDGIYAEKCGFAVRIERGFTTKEEKALGLIPGTWDSRTKIRNVYATYTSSKAQLKKKHYKYMPVEQRKFIVDKPIQPKGTSYPGPSIAAVVYDANYQIDIRESDIHIDDKFMKGLEVVGKENIVSYKW